MKVIILGGTGLLGQYLCAQAKKIGVNYLSAARNDADININITSDYNLQESIIKHKPDVLINACAIVNHQLCDNNASLAYLTNSRPSAILSDLASELNYKYIYISTDGYYSGDKDKQHDENAPLTLMNEYARTKYMGECFTLMNPKALVIRTNIVGFRGKKEQPTFVEWALNALKNREKMTLFDDYYTSSISTMHLSKAIFDLIPKNPSGILNIASSEVSTKKEFIETLAKEFNFSLENTKTGKVSELTSSKRADSLGLDVKKAQELLGYKLPGLSDVIKQLKKESENVR